MDRLRCDRCGEIIGVYEPARLVLPDGRCICGSALTLRGQARAAGTVVLHEACYAELKSAGNAV